MITEKEVKKYFNSNKVGCIGPCFFGLGLCALIGGDSFPEHLFGIFMLIAGIAWAVFFNKEFTENHRFRCRPVYRRTIKKTAREGATKIIS